LSSLGSKSSTGSRDENHGNLPWVGGWRYCSEEVAIDSIIARLSIEFQLIYFEL
jgi:hypothetical protein